MISKYFIQRFASPMGVMITTRRYLLTSIMEPPVDSQVPERPCTIIYAQDDGLYGRMPKWDLSQPLVTDYGLSYTSWECSATDMDAALRELSRDLKSIPNQVLIARGPWISWMAQFYLESLSLAGLVLVDPLPLDQTDAVRQLENMLHKDSRSYPLFQEYVNHWDHWTLKLEPGSVPMLVVSTLPEFEAGAQQTVERHTDTINIPLVKLYNDNAAKQVLPYIVDWIDDQVL